MLTAMTELEAVNAILATVGEAPVPNLLNLFPDGQLARDLLKSESRRVQTLGWTWNTDIDVELTVAEDGSVPVPANLLRFVYRDDPNIIVRGNKLYDRSRRSYTFENSIIAEKLVMALDFDELPEPAKAYVTTRAGRKFQDQYQGSELLHKIGQNDELSAWAALQNYEAEIGDFNVLREDRLVLRIKGRR